MRTLTVALTFLAGLLAAEGVPAQAPSAQPLVPVMPRDRGGMSVGCPSDWEHRDAGAGYFSCRDTDTGAFCNGSSRPSPTVPLDAMVLRARAEIVARGFVVRSERREGTLHSFVYDDAAGHRVVFIVRAAMMGQRLDVTCGSTPALATSMLPVFLEVARAAR